MRIRFIATIEHALSLFVTLLMGFGSPEDLTQHHFGIDHGRYVT